MLASQWEWAHVSPAGKSSPGPPSFQPPAGSSIGEWDIIGNGKPTLAEQVAHVNVWDLGITLGEGDEECMV